MVEKCHICGQQVLTECDMYGIIPRPTPNWITCKDCFVSYEGSTITREITIKHYTFYYLEFCLMEYLKKGICADELEKLIELRDVIKAGKELTALGSGLEKRDIVLKFED